MAGKAINCITFCIVVVIAFMYVGANNEFDEEKQEFCTDFREYEYLRWCWDLVVPDVNQKFSEHAQQCFNVSSDEEFKQLLTETCESNSRSLDSRMSSGKTCMEQRRGEIRRPTEEESRNVRECMELA